MTITTKYEPGDEVWFMHDNRAVTSRVMRADGVHHPDGGEPEVRWEIRPLQGRRHPYYVLPLEESMLFRTKAELLASL